MDISKQEMPTDSFDVDMKKQGPKALKLSTKNLTFIAFAIVTLQVAEVGLQWLVGGSASQQDTFMYAIVVFVISKCIYSKYCLKDAKVKGTPKDDEASEEVEAEEQQGSPVRDTQAYKSVNQTVTRPARSTPVVPAGEKGNWIPKWVKDSAPQRLNAKAKKFVPAGPSNTLDSEAPLFLPTAQQVEEYELLKSESGGEATGEIVYRSRHWLQEIRSDTNKASQKKSTSPTHYKKKVVDLVPAQKVRKVSNSPEPARKKRWQEKVNPTDIKWASAWSTFQAAATL
jgi:hypothetical protein